MSLTSALYTGLSGLDVNSRSLDVAGNNIANLNTTAFKGSRANFTSLLLQNLSYGTAPSSTTGGSNPSQLGLGARFQGTQRNFNNGSIQATGVLTDLALEGNGFFIVDQGANRYYTRAGTFTLNSSNSLVTADGAMVQGYGVDDSFEIVPGVLDDLVVPLGTMVIAEATADVVFAGNLNASGTIATAGSEHESRTFYSDAALTAGNEAIGTEDLTVAGNDFYISDGAGGSFLALEGGTDTIMTVSGVQKAGKEMETKTFAFTDAATAATLEVDDYGTTLEDYADFVEDVLGLNSTDIGGYNLGGGVAITAGKLVVSGNEGTSQALAIESADMTASNTVNAIGGPFIMSSVAEANGESVRTTFIAYDSLGTPVSLDLTFVLQDTVPSGGTLWEFMIESADNNDVDRVVGLGLIEFDMNGNFVSATNQSFSLVRNNGAVSPLTVNMTFASASDSVSALTDTASQLAAVSQDGSPIGTLNAFGIGQDGRITGSFSNGLTRTLGQIALATFTNPEGLMEVGNNLFRTAPNSGSPIEAQPGTFGTGRIISGALELSNVDLSQEFVSMITATTGFSASSRVISTSQQLLQQLVMMQS